MSYKRTCPQCGKERTDDSLSGLCPNCLARYSFLEPEGETNAARLAEGPGGTIQIHPETDLEVERTGLMIGRYKLLEQIGEGGFGLVYMAEQTEPVHRKVALKVIKAGMDTKAVVARFEAERQALALMDHPNIARVLDAGTTQAGRPYFVMELVRGIPITEFCDQKKLPTYERLELFISVCHAVQHAHQKGIIHRDLKPGNVLVTLHDGKPVPKVIDFGVAKALGQRLTEKTLFTGFAHMIGTPAYMSPEQAEMSGLDVDTRSDIYSLGVLLYELLTGVTLFDRETLAKAALDEIRRMIRETEPPKPSTRLRTLGKTLTKVAESRQTEAPKLIHLVRGDLDWIVMKCLEKDRIRRYETANGVAMDIHRYLANEPIVARPPSKIYEFRKTFRRHRFGFLMTGSVIVALAVGFAVATWQAVRATKSERMARTEAMRSAQVAQFIKNMLKGVGSAVALDHDTERLREFLDQTAEQVNSELTQQPGVQLELRTAMSDIYWEIGQNDLAEAYCRQNVGLARELYGDEDPALADALHRLAVCLSLEGGNHVEAEALEREALAIYHGAYGEEHPAVGAALNNLCIILDGLGRHDEALATARRALEMNEKLLGKDDPAVGLSLRGLGKMLQVQGKLQEAEVLHRRDVALQRKLLERQSPVGDPLQLSWALHYLAEVLKQEGKLSEAERLSREALAGGSKMFDPAHRDMFIFSRQLFQVLVEQGKRDEVQRICREEVARQRQKYGDDSEPVARTLIRFGNALKDLSDMSLKEEADQYIMEAFDLFQQYGYPTDNFDTFGLALVVLKQGDLVNAERYLRQAMESRGQGWAGDGWRMNPLKRLAGLLQSQGRTAEAEKLYRDELETRIQQLGEDNPVVAEWRFELARFLASAGKVNEAYAMAEAELVKQTALIASDDPQIARWGVTLAFIMQRQGRVQESLPLLRKGIEHVAPSRLNQLAWSLAISPDAHQRDGVLAVELAEKAVAATDRMNGQYVDTLAAAFAEIGDFTNAVRIQKEANALIPVDEQKSEGCQERLRLYESGQPYRESAEE